MTDHNNSATAAPSPSHELRIRPHHLVCVCFFRGKGYSEEFVANMTETVGRLKASSDGDTIGFSLKDLAKHMLVVGTPGW